MGATTAQAGSVPGGSTVGSGTTPGTGGSGVAGLSLASHVEMATFPWRWAVLLGGLLVLGAGMLVAWRGTRWPVMSSRYDRPASRKPPAATDPASLWESLNQGLDPTDSADPADLTDPPGAPAPPSRITRFRVRTTLFREPHHPVPGLQPVATGVTAAARVRLNRRSVAGQGGEVVGTGASL